MRIKVWQDEGIVHMSSVTEGGSGHRSEKGELQFYFLSWGNEKLLMGFKQRCGIFAFEKDHYAYGK